MRHTRTIALAGILLGIIAGFSAFTFHTSSVHAEGVMAGINDGQPYSAAQPGANGESAGDEGPKPLLATVLSPVAVIAFLIFKLSTFLLGIFGVLFNFAMEYLVFDFGKVFGNSPGMLLAWGVLRDFGNLALIFGFIFMGIATILDLHNYSARKSLPRLVIFAILLNFSLFAAEAVIDTSNVFASTLYKQGYSVSCANDTVSSGTSSGGTDNCGINQGVAGVFMSYSNLTSVYDQRGDGFMQGIQGLWSYISDPIPHILKFLGLALVTTTAAMVLLAGAIMLMGRGIQLALLMVTSPIGFAGMAIPPLEKFANDWWHRLINQALFAPVFLLLLLVSFKLMEGLSALANQEGGITRAFNVGGQIDVGPLFFLVLMVGFMVAALMAAKKFGVWGADFAVNSASALSFGSLAHASNFVAGGAAYGLRRAQQATGFLGPVGRAGVNRVLRPIETTNLDLRRIPGVGAALGVAGITEGAKPSEHSTFGDIRHAFDDANPKKERARLEAKYAAEVAGQELEDAAHHGALRPQDERTLASMSDADISKLHGLTSPAIAQALSAEQFAKQMETDKLTDVEKEKLMNERFKKLILAVGNARTNPDAAKDEVKRWSTRDLEMLAKKSAQSFETLMTATTANGSNLYTSDQYEALAKSNALTNSQRQMVKDQSVAGRIEINVQNGGSSAAAKQLAELLKPKQKAQLSGTAMTSAGVLESLSHGDLAAIMSRDELKPAEISAIASAVRSATHPNFAKISNYLASNRNAGAYWQ